MKIIFLLSILLLLVKKEKIENYRSRSFGSRSSRGRGFGSIFGRSRRNIHNDYHPYHSTYIHTYNTTHTTAPTPAPPPPPEVKSSTENAALRKIETNSNSDEEVEEVEEVEEEKEVVKENTNKKIQKNLNIIVFTATAFLILMIIVFFLYKHN